MALRLPAWVGKASTAVSTSKAPDVKLCSERGNYAQDPQSSGSEYAKVTYSLDTLNLCGLDRSCCLRGLGLRSG